MGEQFFKGKKTDKKLILFAAIALLGVLILVFSGIYSSRASGADAVDSGAPDPEAYSEKLESEVIALCKSVAGNCEVNAVVSLSGGYKSVYASDKQSSSSGYKNSTVLVGSGSSEGAVLVCYENPEIAGIGIVLSRSYDEAVENSIISLVSAAFDVGKNKIHVAFGK